MPLMVRVPDIGQHGEGCALWQIVQIDHGNFAGGSVLIAIGQVARLGGRAAGQHVIGGGAAAVCIPRTLQLVSSGSAAPKEIFAESVVCFAW